MKATLSLLALLIPVTLVVLGMSMISNAFAADGGAVTSDAGAVTVAGDAGPTQPAAVDSEDPIGAVAKLVAAARRGDWREVIALFLVLVTAALLFVVRRVGKVSDWLTDNDWAAVLAVFLTSFMGALGTSLLADSPVDFAMFRSAFTLALLAAGGYGALWKKLAVPLLVKIGLMKAK